MPSYLPSNLIKPDYPSLNGSSPGFLNYPTTLVHTVHEIPGHGGSYTGITPLWAAIPSPNGNTYYEAVNKALGAKITMQPSNGNTYNNILPPLFSGNKLPDWIQIPTFWTGPLNFGQAVGAKLADLTPYLAGDKVKQYPNLAALFPGAWQAGIWNNKIYGIPVFPTEFTVAGYLYYRPTSWPSWASARRRSSPSTTCSTWAGRSTTRRASGGPSMTSGPACCSRSTFRPTRPRGPPTTRVTCSPRGRPRRSSRR
jgi:Bacterial extracellular solute-binding protein